MLGKMSLFDRRKRRVRSALRANATARPRLSVFRSSKHIYAQLIDDALGRTLAGYRYHGRIKALADGARAGGLEL